MAQEKANSASVALIAVGGVLGAVVGAFASRLFIRADATTLERNRQRGPQGLKLSVSTMLSLAIAVVGLVRQIGALGDES
jgi:small-conductance mechanosensitive channel